MRAFSFLFIIYMLIACPDSYAQDKKMLVYSGIPPVAGLVETIGGENIESRTLLGPRDNPHIYEPKPQQIMQLSQAKILFIAGIPFEKNIADTLRSRDKSLVIIDLSANLPTPDETHDDGAAGHGNHGDPHIWLSPDNLITIVRQISASLSDIDPARQGTYRANAEALVDQITNLHTRTKQELAPYKGTPFFVYHPAYSYFASAYGLIQKPVEIEGKSPSPRQLEELIKDARATKTSIIIVQPQFNTRSAHTLAQAIDGKLLPIDPLDKDVLKTMEILASAITQFGNRTDTN